MHSAGPPPRTRVPAGCPGSELGPSAGGPDPVEGAEHPNAGC
jgi:hypothetical protein